MASNDTQTRVLFAISHLLVEQGDAPEGSEIEILVSKRIKELAKELETQQNV